MRPILLLAMIFTVLGCGGSPEPANAGCQQYGVPVPCHDAGRFEHALYHADTPVHFDLVDAPAPAVPAPTQEDADQLVQTIVAVWDNGGWVAVLGLVLMLVTSAVRLVGQRFVPFLTTRNGKLTTAVVVALLGGGGGALVKGNGLIGALGVGLAALVAAPGIFSLIKNAAQPNNAPGGP
jgi:hypothetical protein